jgi:polyhydroxybutyrate depolymerase
VRSLLVLCAIGFVACNSGSTGGVEENNTTTPHSGAPVVNTSGGSGTPTKGVAAGTTSTGTPAPPAPGMTVTTESLVVGSDTRSYLLVVPQTYSASRSYPLVLALHGDDMNATSMQSKLNMEAVSGQNAIVVYPNGMNSSWNLYAPSSNDPDGNFLTELLGALRGRYNVSDAFGLGLSSGAFMVNEMACRNPALFKGIISNSGGVPAEPNQAHDDWNNDPNWARCSGQDTGVAALVIHGNADGVVQEASGQNDANYWAFVNNCGTSTSAANPSPCIASQGCPSDKPVVFCAIDGLGHALWTSTASAAWTFITGL